MIQRLFEMIVAIVLVVGFMVYWFLTNLLCSIIICTVVIPVGYWLITGKDLTKRMDRICPSIMDF